MHSYGRRGDQEQAYADPSSSRLDERIDIITGIRDQSSHIQDQRQDTQHNNNNASSPTSGEAAALDRQSTVGSIVDKYLDRNHQRSLQRKTSAQNHSTSKKREVPERKPTLDLLASPQHILEEVEEEDDDDVYHTMAPSNTQAFKKRQSSIMFAKGTKKVDGSGTGNRDRDSGGGAFAGMLMDGGDSSDSDSDSDNELASKIPPAAASATARGGQGDEVNRASWTSRAVAVGDRPPDSASQNPPTLKMLGLKSQKEGGAPLGHGRQPSPRQLHPQPLEHESRRTQRQPSFHDAPDGRVVSGSDYGEDAGRHGSYIDFGGPAAVSPFRDGGDDAHPPSRGFQLEDPPVNDARSLQAPRSPMQERARSPRTAALTQELGLASPLPQDDQGARSPTRDEYFATPLPPAMANPHSASIPLQRGGEQPPRSPMHGPVGGGGPGRGPPSPHGMRPEGSQSYERGPGPQAGRQLVPNPGDGPARRPSQAPIPVPAPAVVPRASEGDGPPPYAMNNARPGPQGGPPQSRYAPRQGPGFSDSPGPNAARGGGGPPGRRPSMLRRSMAFFSGNQGAGPSAGGGAGGPQRRPSQQRRSIFRKSMAFLTGRPMPQPEPEPEEEDPMPRVQGWVTEKPQARKSHYWGAGGMGDEWDVNGNGAKFWRRFSAAQKRDANGIDKAASDAVIQKAQRRAKCFKWGSLMGGLLIIAAVVGVIIWREAIVNNSNKLPGAVDRGNNGGSYVPPSGKGNAATGATGGTSPQQSSTDTSTTTDSASAGTAADGTTSNAATDDTTDDTTTTTKKKHHHKHRKTSKGTTRRDELVSTALDTNEDLLSRREDFSQGLRSSTDALTAGSHPLPRRSQSFGNAALDIVVRRHHGDQLRRRRVVNQSHDVHQAAAAIAAAV
ncbi:hypothetical protein FA10DRAFT_99758 [Acaromyces ingoldii]|uniref:Uncharacterized protein n=1 Tax=Acaromyces ingoldii TaxID=215250 RepID=A0A316YKZ6_9BASI|nr:hypothetical protein FA10DRAFT_99758 [Acaromyces ingoldii]PWN89889.1 hypothetical protein FA10DRAFT_99758 [Acaromyces ingoldii]